MKLTTSYIISNAYCLLVGTPAFYANTVLFNNRAHLFKSSVVIEQKNMSLNRTPSNISNCGRISLTLRFHVTPLKAIEYSYKTCYVCKD